MSNEVRDSYDAMAEQYTAFALGDLERVPSDRDWLATFATMAASQDGVVADLGCGPGYVVKHLNELGLSAVGYDISKKLIDEARRAFPDSHFRVGDLTAMDVPDCSIGGIVSRYSLIHSPPSYLDAVWCEWLRILEPGAPALLSFFAASSAEDHGVPFDHAVTTAYELFPATIMEQLQEAGFSIIEFGTREPLGGERPLDHGTVLAQKIST